MRLLHYTGLWSDYSRFLLVQEFVCVTLYLDGQVECHNKETGVEYWDHYSPLGPPFAMDIYAKGYQEQQAREFSPHHSERKEIMAHLYIW